MDELYYQHVITQQGLAFLAKQQLGAEPNITRIVAGEGMVDHLELEKQTQVSTPISEMEIGGPSLVDSKTVKLTARLTNQEIYTTALIRQVGVYAEDPDEGEILYQLLQYSIPQPLPSADANRGSIAVFECEIDLVFANAQAAAIPVTPGWFLTRADLDAHNTDPEAHEGLLRILMDKMDLMAEEFWASQEIQDTRIKLLEDTLITDINDNKKIIVFGNISDIRLIQGVFNENLSRIEC